MHLFFTELRIGFAAPSYSASEGGFIQPVVSTISGILSAGLTASVHFSTTDGVAVGKFCVWVTVCKHFMPLSAAPDDYNTTMHILQFTSTTQTMTVPVPLKTDELFEATELFFAELVAVTTTFPITLNPLHTNLSIIDTNGESKSAPMIVYVC